MTIFKNRKKLLKVYIFKSVFVLFIESNIWREKLSFDAQEQAGLGLHRPQTIDTSHVRRATIPVWRAQSSRECSHSYELGKNP